MKLNKVAIVSKFGSKISEDAAEMISKKLIAKKIKVYTIAPVSVSGAEKVESLEDLSKIKLDLADNFRRRWNNTKELLEIYEMKHQF